MLDQGRSSFEHSAQFSAQVATTLLEEGSKFLQKLKKRMPTDFVVADHVADVISRCDDLERHVSSEELRDFRKAAAEGSVLRWVIECC